MKKEPKVLFVFTKWPSAQHPYLFHLVRKLDLKISVEKIFIFKKNEMDFYADELKKNEKEYWINKIRIRPNSRNILKYLLPFSSNLIFKWKAFYSFWESMESRGLTLKNKVKFCLEYYELIGEDYDLVYLNSLQTAEKVPLKSLFPNSKIVASSRGQDFDYHLERYDLTLNDLDILHVLGDYLKRKAISRGFEDKKIVKIPPAAIFNLNRKLNKSKSIEDREIIISSASRLHWVKGFEYVLRAIGLAKKELKGINIKYYILGDGPEMEFLNLEVVRLDLKSEVEFLGWKNQSDVDRIVQNSDIYILLSIAEGFNNSVIQAQNLGIPCIVSDSGGLPENVADKKTGYVVNSYDSHAAAKAIVKLIKSIELRKELGIQAKVRARTIFSLEGQIELYTKMFDKALNR